MSTPSLADRLESLDVVLELGAGRLDPAALSTAAAVRARADERLARGDDAVVAALCGGTGCGKSSLFNVLAGRDLAPTGVRRPVTAAARALAVGDPEATGAVCDWLDVPHRHHVPATGDLPDGLVLLDLPDTDSVAADHRVLAARFVERVDLLVWVTDALKYAHRSLHHGYLDRLTAHAAVVVVVLNRIDELTEAQRRDCLEDLRRLLDADGLGAARLLATSARTGEGVGALRELLADEARRRRAAAERIAADVRVVAETLRADTGPAVGERTFDRAVVESLAGAVGVPGIAAAAARTYQKEARTATRGLPSRMAARTIGRVGAVFESVRAIGRGGDTGQRPAAASATLPVRRALAAARDAAAAGLPPRWDTRLRDVIDGLADTLPRRLATAVDAVRLTPPRRRWWQGLGALLGITEVALLAGLVWLAVLAGLDYLLLPSPPTPMVTSRLSWPTALVIGGLILRVAGGVLRRRLVAVGVRRHQRRVQERLLSAVERVTADEVIAPLRAELAAHDRLAAALTRASAPASPASRQPPGVSAPPPAQGPVRRAR